LTKAFLAREPNYVLPEDWESLHFFNAFTLTLTLTLTLPSP